MRVSTKGRYGLRMMVELASLYGQGPVLVETIAKAQGISGKYLHVIVGGLKASGLVRAIRGPSGGYELTRPPSEISALDVVSALEGRTCPVDCVERTDACPRSAQCAARDLWCEVGGAIDGVLGRLSLEELARRQKAKENAAAMYHI